MKKSKRIQLNLIIFQTHIAQKKEKDPSKEIFQQVEFRKCHLILNKSMSTKYNLIKIFIAKNRLITEMS